MTNASSDNLNSCHPNGNPDDPQQHPPHCALSREASKIDVKSEIVIYMVTRVAGGCHCPKFNQLIKVLFGYSFKNNTSFVSRFNTLRRGRSSMHHNKFSATTNASSDNLNSGHPNGNPDDPQQPPPHCALSREASLKKGSDAWRSGRA